MLAFKGFCKHHLYEVSSNDLNKKSLEELVFKASKMVKAIGPKVHSCDGNDALKVHGILKKATNETRKGNGPYFLEFSTYRWLEHCGPNFDNNIGYRSEDEFLKWKKKEPIQKLVKKISSKSKNHLEKIRNQVKLEVKSSFNFAEKSPFPKQSDAYEGIYAKK